MPLPNGINQPWPPEDQQPITSKIAVWSAWYSGDPDQLSVVYGGAASGNDTTGFFASERGGIINAARKAIANFFWGRRQTPTEPRDKLHVPIAGDIAAASADLLFSEPPTVKVPDATGENEGGNKATQERLDELVDDGVHATLLEAAEICAALGGVYLRIVWDTNTRDMPWLSPVHPDAAVPEWRWGCLSAVTFWKIVSQDGKKVVRHLERHEPGRILHGVYAGDEETLGEALAVKDFPPDLGITKDVVETGSKRLTACYIPNMRPNRLWRNVPAAAHLGRSDFASQEPLMDALDETYSSLMRDVQNGKGRVIVPAPYLQSNGAGSGTTFDGERRIYEALGGILGSEQRMDLEVVQFDIRVAEHEQTALNLLNRIVSGAGYSAQTFGLTGEVAMTATEVAAKERRSFITRDRKITYWRPALAEIIATLLEVDAAIFKSGVKPVKPVLEFGDSVSQDPLSQAQTLQALEAAKAASTKTKVRMLHPDWEDDAVDEEVEAIDAAGALADPYAAPPGAAPPGAAPPGQDDDEDQGDPKAKGKPSPKKAGAYAAK